MSTVRYVDVAPSDVRPGDSAYHYTQDLDPREVAYVDHEAGAIALRIHDHVTGLLPIENYRLTRRVTDQHPKIARPKVTMAPAELETRHPMYIASCEHCDWTAGPTAKSYLAGTEMPMHRKAHREGRAAVTR